MKKNTDYIPGTDDALRAWIVSFLAKLPTQGAAIGITTPEQSALGSMGAATTASIDNLKVKKNDYDSALANRSELRRQFLVLLRPIVRRAKTSTTYTETIGEALGIVPSDTPINPSTIQPELAVSVHLEDVRVRVNRGGAESANLYVRLMGQPEWTLLGRVTRSTFVDNRPLANPAVPEIREYMAQGFLGDTPVGLPSQSKAVIFCGTLAA